jgi:malate synthase
VPLEFRSNVRAAYADVYTAAAVDALEALAPLDADRQALMRARIERRAARARDRRRIAFLDPAGEIPRTRLRVQDARDGAFEGSEIPADLERQWIQGTGPGAKPRAPLDESIRHVAYALLSGADGWMFDGEDALGQISTMSLDNQRNLKLAIHGDAVFLSVASGIARQIGVADWRRQLGFTTKIFRARGLHLDDRHVRHADGRGFSASLADTTLFIVNNHGRLRAEGSSLVL